MKQLRGIFASFTGALLSLACARAAVVIHEIHYDPDVKTEAAEFIELHNTGPGAVNLAGWTLSDGGNLLFTFPATNVAAGGYVVAAQSPALIQSKFGAAGAVGPLRADGTTTLSKYGEKLTLRNAGGGVEDEVEFQLGFPWPTVGEATTPGAGKSIELIHPSLDNNLGGSWRAAGGGAGTPPSSTTLLPAASTWKFRKGTNEPSAPVTAWRQAGFNDAAWTDGALPIGYGETFLATTLGDMNGLYPSVFLRKQFTVSNPGQYTSLALEAQYDDGFKCWINGVLVVDGSANMTAGEVPYSGSAISALENLNFVTINLAGSPGTLLADGNNTIAVQAHNSSISASSDFFFDARLIGQIGGSGGSAPTPGRINTVFATNAPPQTRQVEHTPKEPRGNEPVRVTAKVTDPDGVASVVLQYQIVAPGSYIERTSTAYTNAANWISLAMNDGGTNGDLAAGDDVFSAEIPASVQAHRRLIRYRITVTDTGGRAVRVPYADDPQPNFAYFVYNGVPAWSGAVQPGGAGSNGVVRTVSSNEMGRLPVIHLIGTSNAVTTATWFSRYGGDAYQWQGTLVYDGQVLDHIRYRARGGVWRYSMVKNMWKFDLNRGHDIEVRDNWGRKFKTAWTKLNLGAGIQQRDFWHRGEQNMFEAVGHRIFQMAGVAGPHTAFASFRVIDDALEQDPATQYEGDFWGVYLMIEQENGRFLEERDLPDSNLYKMESGTGELNNLSPAGPTDKSDLNYILNNYTAKPESWWRTNWNLPKYYSYQAVAQAIHHYDICYDKNFFYYFDPRTRLWEICSWDLDLTWANNMYDAGCGGKDRVYQRIIDEVSPAKPNIRIEWNNRMREFRDLFWNSDQAWKLIDEYAALLRGPLTTNGLLDADRMMWDYNPKMASGTYTPNLSKAMQGEYYKFTQHPGTNGGFWSTLQIMRSYVNVRGAFLDGLHNDTLKPNQPTLTYTGPSNYPINRLSFRASTYSGGNPFASMRWRVGEITDTNAPNYRADEPRKYELEAVWDSGALSNFTADVTVPANFLRVGSRYRARVQFADATGRASHWSPPHEFTCGEPGDIANLLAFLRITEVMFHPPPGGYEFIELHNSSSTVTLDLSGVKLTQGVDFTCLQGTTIPPLGYLVIAGTADIAAFRAFYGLAESVPVIGPFDGGLNNAGEQLTLRTAAGGSDIVAFNFSDGRGWPAQADGAGHSLVLLGGALDAQGGGAGEYGGNWRASGYLRGSAGGADVVPPPSVVLNEIVAHTDDTNGVAPSNDWIELYNPTASPITLPAGWYLSDDGSTYAALKKWMIPAGTIVPAHGFVSFDENTGFHNPTNTGFGISKEGEQIFLSYLPGTAQDRVADAVSFKGQENDWSLGRYPDGGAFWHALTPRTRGTNNAPPPARLVVSEILYRPPDVLAGTNYTDNSHDEFIELHNATPDPLTLDNANGVWRLNGGVGFDFPTNFTLGAGAYLLVVNFDPATNATELGAFKGLYGITDPLLPILGPYTGKLANNSDRVAIERPQAGDGTNDPLNWVVVDEVIYADQSPFPCGTDGSGNSLQRLASLQHGSDPANWSGEPPTAGRPRADLPAGLPAITAPPRDQIVATNGTAGFSVSVCGSPPFTYQWRFNSNSLAGATNATLTLANVTPAQAGHYDVVVSNPAGSVPSPAATLIVQYPPVITADPQPATAVRDLSAMFSVGVGGTAPFGYQWRFNGASIPGATNSTLLLSPVRTNDAGLYSVLVHNTAGSVLSASAQLSVLVPATITAQPTNRTVTVVTNHMTNATFTVAAIGTGALLYQWRFNGAVIPWGTEATLTLTNVQTSDAGSYSVVVTDTIGSAISSNAALTVLVTPRFLTAPGPQSAVAGGSVTFSGSITGYPPPFTFELRNPSTNLQVKVQNDSVVFFTLANLTTNETRSYRIVAKNLAVPTGVATPIFAFTVLADSDGDGIPDAWETNFGFSPTNGMDGTNDFDGDGLSNAAEYIAGTDPTNDASYLKVEQLLAVPGTNLLARIEFNAVSNRTYTVQSSPALAPQDWIRVTDVPATTNNRPVILFDPQPATNTLKLYRLVTPRLP